MKTNNTGAFALLGCGWLGCVTLGLIINLTIGGFCFDYVLWAGFGKDIPWYADAACGLFLGQFSIPSAIIFWILHFFIETPFFGGGVK